ncbi:NAD(P)/FAD-dependent oxidoreductase [Luteolibacter sp. GHJ8]|uniref:NAD(P)/FAD-dependent oxidoreductase n=1 Tax=Luteolibacter rhizosphaerae TaxID=2989719 RepID=A0ABT3FZX5_9BACT|nr:NAD(P)/FAD-dependent oxidoreductase [Luteolibacter rhizosphaerae]MCW1913144.1 NAD(P)/FAD-dependent oxidoreductase [Luteolibacter rhizosphaerae]
MYSPFELIVIGGGSAGHAAARTAAELGAKTALVESADELGGLCILRGCMPSKALIETANRMRMTREAARFGFRAGEPQLDLPALRERLHRLIDDFRQDRVHAMEKAPYALLRGSARFRSAKEILFQAENSEPRMLEARTFVIATGSLPSVPQVPGLKDTPFWTSDDVVQLPDIPKRIAILGSGAIGMEFAHLFEGFGCAVTVIARGKRIMGNSDPDIAEAMEAESRERGIRFLKETEAESVSHGPDGFRLKLSGETSELTADALLVATGRRPATAGLGLEEIGIAMEKGRILIDERAATSLRCIYAAGDCASPVPVVHLAVLQGEVAARNALLSLRDDHFSSAAEWPRHSAMSGWFTEPQCVQIGLSETAAKEDGIEVIVGRQTYADHGKGMIAGSRHGFVKVLADPASGRLLGAAGIGPDVVETGHLLQAAIEQQLTLSDYLRIPHYHPTLAEAWSRAVEDAKECSG